MAIKLSKPFKQDFRITQGFGENYETYKWIKDINGKSILGHNGIDFGYAGNNFVELFNPFPKNSEVVVSKVGWDKDGYGRYIRLWDKTQNFVILMAHCAEIKKKQWESVNFGELVAVGDNTGWSTGPHLHCAGYHVTTAGEKLNRDNGYDGFVNLMDGRIVEWQSVLKDWRDYFNFDVTKRLKDDIWFGLNFDKTIDLPRETALDSLPSYWNELMIRAKKLLAEKTNYIGLIDDLTTERDTLKQANIDLDIKYNKLKAEKDIGLAQAFEFIFDYFMGVINKWRKKQ